VLKNWDVATFVIFAYLLGLRAFLESFVLRIPRRYATATAMLVSTAEAVLFFVRKAHLVRGGYCGLVDFYF
jgi:hypothetical protein